MATAILSNDQLQKSTNDTHFAIFHLIWLDAAIDTKDVQYAEQNLRSIIHHLKKFKDIETCENYIKQCSQLDRIIMIVSNELGQEIISSIYKLRQVISIYVYSIDQKTHAQWADKFTKVKAFVIEIDKLILKIKADYKIQKKMEEPLAVHFFNPDPYAEQSIRDMSDQFIFSQVLIDCFLRIQSNQTDTKELVYLCEKQYADNSVELNNIREFKENYSSDQILSWYMRKSFFADTLHAVLCKNDIYLTFLFRTFLVDIQNALRKYQPENFLRLYRSQTMTNNELENWKQFCGQFMSSNSFFSASTDYHRIVSFLNIPDNADNLAAVLFEIDADPTIITTKPFADISSYSKLNDEFEILFMVGSIFHITSVNRSDNGLIWVIRMTLCNDEQYRIKEILMPMKQQIQSEEMNLQVLGKILCKMNKFNLAENYYSHFVERLPSNHSSLGNLYESLSELATQTGDSTKSAMWHQKALKLKPNSTRMFLQKFYNVETIVLS